MRNKPKILITSGPTREYIDPVRFLSNASSGKMGIELSLAAVKRGFDVTVITGPVELEYKGCSKVIKVTSAKEMFISVKREFKNCDILIGAAAVSDYSPVIVQKHKMKKNGRFISLKLAENPDIIAYAGKNKANKVVVGFALESENIIQNAVAKLKQKNLDMVVANEPSSIGKEMTSVMLVKNDGHMLILKNAAKTEAAKRIIDETLKIFKDRKTHKKLS